MIVIWASPPCQTFSPADSSNITRNNNFRDHDDPTKPPTSTNEGKARIAREHDALVKHIFDIFDYSRDINIQAGRVLENPRGYLENRDYMQPEMMHEGYVKELIDQCAFGREFQKPTHLWHDLKSWSPKGVTGSGRCESRCGKGVMDRGYYKHFKGLAMEPYRKPRGKGQGKEKNLIPALLLEEVLLASSPSTQKLQGKVVIDLCSGFQSWKPVAQKFGCKYIAIDILGDRNKTLP